MPVEGFTLPAIYLRQIAEQIRNMGADVGHWLGLSQLSEAQLNDPALSVSYATFERLVLDSLRLTREPALGLLVGERLLASTHGIVGYAAMNSGTTRQAIELVERYSRLRTSILTITHDLRPNEVRICFKETLALGEIRRPVLEAVGLSIKNVFDSISMGACPVSYVAFPFEDPGYAELAREMFRCDVRYGQSWSGAALPADALDVPLKMADPAAFEEATRICQRELEKLTGSESLAAQIRRMLLEKQHAFPSLTVTARLFHVTPRTLHRRLLEEGTSYKELLEDVRHMLAVEYLKAGRLSIEEIAYTLGYSDLANFRRAFKRWESMAPSEFRAQHVKA
jgi:AraC-like DNA-binding protein